MKNSTCLRDHSRRVFSFSAMYKLTFPEFRRNVQPSPQVAISEGWEHVTNKYLEFYGNGKSFKIYNLTEKFIACSSCPEFGIANT